MFIGFNDQYKLLISQWIGFIYKNLIENKIEQQTHS